MFSGVSQQIFAREDRYLQTNIVTGDNSFLTAELPV